MDVTLRLRLGNPCRPRRLTTPNWDCAEEERLRQHHERTERLRQELARRPSGQDVGLRCRRGPPPPRRGENARERPPPGRRVTELVGPKLRGAIDASSVDPLLAPILFGLMSGCVPSWRLRYEVLTGGKTLTDLPARWPLPWLP